MGNVAPAKWLSSAGRRGLFPGCSEHAGFAKASFFMHRHVVLRLLLVLIGAIACSRQPSPAPTLAKPPSGPVLFEDVTGQVGLNFVHDSGSRGGSVMPEHIGSGLALFDYDNDGRLDMYLIQCGGAQSSSRNQLYHQEPDGTFRNVSPGSGLDVAGLGMGVTAGDVNNDGWTDLLVTEYGRIRLFLNPRGRAFRRHDRASGAG